ncbi:MAG TPA: hypothetical protein VIP51_16875 [Eoetvoesiella sp.]
MTNSCLKVDEASVAKRVKAGKRVTDLLQRIEIFVLVQGGSVTVLYRFRRIQSTSWPLPM